jgi:hypothetical protein
MDWGLAISAGASLLGGMMGGGGGGGDTQQLPTMTPEQLKLLNDIIAQIDPQQLSLYNDSTYKAGLPFLMQLLGGDTSAIEQPVMRQFNEQILPGIANRVSGLGAGAQRSSGYQNMLSDAASDLAGNLASLKYNARSNALNTALSYSQAGNNSLMNMASLALGKEPFGYQHTPSTPGMMDSLGSGLMGALGQGLGTGLSSKISGLFA